MAALVLGTNDAGVFPIPEYEYGFAPLQAAYYSDYKRMIQTFIDLEVDMVIVMGVPMLTGDTGGFGRYAAGVQINNMLPCIASEMSKKSKKTNVVFLDSWQMQARSGLSERELVKDPLHPDAVGM